MAALSSPSMAVARIDDGALAALLARHAHDPHALVQILREAQAVLGWLPRDALAGIARALGLTLAHVEGVAGFYRFFHLRPVGEYRVLFSDNITDRMLGSQALMADLCRRLGVQPGQVRADGRVSVATTSCTGLCDQGPALLINHRHVVVAARCAAHCATGGPDRGRHAGRGVAAGMVPGRRQHPSRRRAAGHAAAARRGHRGRTGARRDGGARRGEARPPARARRRRLRDRSEVGVLPRRAGPRACVVCNADEGEPGTFKDRVLLTRHADLCSRA